MKQWVTFKGYIRYTILEMMEASNGTARCLLQSLLIHLISPSNRHVSGFQRLPGLYVGEPPIFYIAPVYCEVKLLLHLFNEDDQSLRDRRSNKPASTINYSN